MAGLRAYGLYLDWIVALVATAGSLQRGAAVHPLHPLRVPVHPNVPALLGIASYRQDRGIIPYALPLAVFGGSVALVHYLEQKVPGFGVPNLCRAGGVPCNTDYSKYHLV